MHSPKGLLPKHPKINPDSESASPLKPSVKEKEVQSPNSNTKCDGLPSASNPIIPQFTYSQ